MAGTIVADIIQSDQSYPSSINIASPMIVSNTINMSNGSLTGNVNFDSGTLFVDSVNNRVGIGTQNPVVGLQVTNPSGSGQIRVVSSGGDIVQVISDSSEASIRAVAAVPLTFRTSNEERMKIDSAGRVTMPYQPTFSAYASSNFTKTAGTFAYDITLFNNGSHYSTSTGRFTAPVAGYYAFFHKMSTDANVAFEVKVRVNNSEIARSYIIASTSARSLTTSTICYLNVNDYAEPEVYVPSSTTFFGGVVLHSNFLGYLLG